MFTSIRSESASFPVPFENSWANTKFFTPLAKLVTQVTNAIFTTFSTTYRTDRQIAQNQVKTGKKSLPAQATAVSTATQTSNILKVGTYNILKPEAPDHLRRHAEWYDPHKYIGFNANGESNWDSRKQVIVQNIINANLDVLCLQEVIDGFVPELSTTLKDKGYTITWVGHTDNNSPWEHGVAVAYKIQKFEEVISENGTFIDNHFKTKSGTDKQRRHKIVELKDRRSSEITRIASAHLLDTRNIKPLNHRVTQIKQIITELESRPADRYVIAGDFNQDQFGNKDESRNNAEPRAYRSGFRHEAKSSIEKALEENNYRTDGSREPTNSYRDPVNFECIRKGKRKIDWIFAKGKINSLKSIGKGDFRFNPTASDHFMVATSMV